MDVSRTLVDILAFLLLLVPIAGLLACIFLWQVYFSDQHRPRSWVLFRLATAATVTEILSVVFGMLALVRFAGVSLAGLGAVILAIGVLGLEVIPIWFAVSVYRIRQKEQGNQNGN